MTDRVVTQDMARVLDCLRDGPSTCREIADSLRLTRSRTNALLVELARKQTIHAPRCTISAKGVHVNLWELKTRKEVSA
jgi:transcription initiation factor IIE alpha subunit